MKVTKPKKGKRLKASPSGKISAVLPSLLKKTLEKSRGAGLVLFGNDAEDGWREGNIDREVAIAAKDSGKSFNLRLAESSLDVYRSPHLLDLSRRNRIADAMRYRPKEELKISDLPLGDFLDKYGILDFWDFDRSEILIACRRYIGRIRAVYSSIFDRPEFAPLLISEKRDKAAKSHLEEAAVIGLILFFADFYYKIYLSCYKFLLVSGLMLGKMFAKDETVWLPKGKLESNQKMEALMKRLVSASREPTISELLQGSSPKKESQTGKFKIVNQDPNRKKQIQEKYLADSFTRKGVVVATQHPASIWPKDSFAWDIGNFVFSRAALKPAAAALGIIIALAASIQVMSTFERLSGVKGRVMGEAEQALSNLNSAAGDLQAMDFSAARDKFPAANSNFVSAQNQLDEIKSFITVLAEVAPAENTFKSGTNIIDMGEHLSNAAGRLLDGIGEATGESGLSLASRIKNLSLALTPALEELKAADANAGNIGLNNLPEDQREKFLKLKAALPQAIASLQNLSESAAFAVKVLGDNDMRRYLLMFQNDNELRATGGFMGSFALVDLRGGKIDKISLPAGGTYDVRAGFNQLVAPPEPLRLVTDRWEFQDSNWWADFPASAKNIKWFFEKSGGPTVDGVIAVNSEFLGRLLAVTGPIDLPQYGKTITADNYEIELQKSIELEARDKTKPKKILSELAPLLMEKLLSADPKQFFNLAEVLSKGFKSRDIQMYFADSGLEQFAAKSGWDGGLSSMSGSDYLSVNSTNIGGGKTDSAIRQKIFHTAEIANDGSVTVKVLIERRNIGPIDDYFTTIANNSYIRVYVPEGSRLLYAKGFDGFSDDKFKPVVPGADVKAELAAENSAAIDPDSGTKIYSESGKTVFANWSVAGPGEKRELLLVYKLPFKVAFSTAGKNIIEKTADYFSAETAAYSFKFQKQPGRSSDEIYGDVVFPDNLNLKLLYPEAAQVSGNRASYSGDTSADRFLIAGFANK